MLNTTLARLRCPKCHAPLGCTEKAQPATRGPVYDIEYGTLKCKQSGCIYPILAGVAILVTDVRIYLMNHAKGVSCLVREGEIPQAYARDYRVALDELDSEDFAEDLETLRVNSLYLMNHYLRVEGFEAAPWWQPREGQGSKLFDELIRQHWDNGPFAQILDWVKALGRQKPDAVELGSGVGGLAPLLKPHVGTYLGIDSSFLSVVLARHRVLGARPFPGPEANQIPEDLLFGPVSRSVQYSKPASPDGSIDFVVGDIDGVPLTPGSCDLVFALNAIDMLDDPQSLPILQNELLKPGGVAIQSGPYIWMERVARTLRKRLPKTATTSAAAVEWLYAQNGFEVEKRIEHLPWLFLKHSRQLELYSVHLLQGRKK